MRTRSSFGALALMALLAAGAAACSNTPLPPGALGTGPYTFSQTVVAAGNGFGGGTIYTPTGGGPSSGPYPAFVVVPGYTASQSSIAWTGTLLASQGFVVFTIDTNTTLDDPSARSVQQLAAMTYLTDQSAVKAKVDKTRLAAMGWSMGGGGSLRSALAKPNLKAVVTLAGWEPFLDVSGVTVPTLVVACQGDSIAENTGNSQRFYSGIASAEKAYLEIASSTNHFCVTSSDQTIANTLVPWAKVFVAGDTSYAHYLCPGPAVAAPIVSYQATCPIP
jgi:dienelactone hydrolase